MKNETLCNRIMFYFVYLFIFVTFLKFLGVFFLPIIESEDSRIVYVLG